MEPSPIDWASWRAEIHATLMFIIRDGEILLIEKKRGIGAGKINGPGGKIDPGETSLQTAKRELLEETGHAAREWAPLVQIHPAIGFSNEVIDIFVARGLERRAEAAPDHGELIDVEWATLGALVDALRAGQLPDVKTHIAVMHLQRMVDGDWPWPEFAPA
jgi:8-oxo-dGTP pyrophosphatase MutT (NUDIX family)